MLRLYKNEYDYTIVLTKKVFNPQTEITDYQDLTYGHFGNLDFVLKEFDRIRKGFKLRIKLSGLMV